MRLLYLFLALAIAVLLPFLIWGAQFETYFTQEGAVAWLRSYGAWAWSVAIVLLIVDLFLPIPASAVMAALGFVYGPVTGGLIGTIGSVLSGALAYGLCRAIGRRASLVILGERDLQRGERLFARTGGWLVVLSRWLPIFPEVIACMAGMMRMPVSHFFIALACGCAPVAFTYSAMGHLGAAQPVLTLALTALLPPMLWLVAQHVHRRRSH